MGKFFVEPSFHTWLSRPWQITILRPRVDCGLTTRVFTRARSYYNLRNRVFCGSFARSFHRILTVLIPTNILMLPSSRFSQTSLAQHVKADWESLPLRHYSVTPLRRLERDAAIVKLCASAHLPLYPGNLEFGFGQLSQRATLAGRSSRKR